MEQVAKSKITKGSSFFDETYRLESSPSFHLSLEIGKHGITASVLDLDRNKYIGLVSYNFQSSPDLKISLENAGEIFDNDIFKARYKSISVGIITSKSTLVPLPLFDKEKANELLYFNHIPEANEVIKIDEIRSIEAKNIYTVPKILENILSNLKGETKIIHHSTVLIEEILKQNKNIDGKKIFINVNPAAFDMIATGDKKLIFYNSFRYQTAEDFIYYLLFACEQLKLNPETLELTLIGQIERNSGIYALLYKYIRNIRFGVRSDSFEYSYRLEEIPNHFYFTLFNQKLCV